MRPVANPDSQPPEILTVTCPTCHERFRVYLALELQSVACTYCATKLNIPSQKQVEKQHYTATNHPRPMVEEYAVAQPSVTAPPEPINGMSRAEMKALAASQALLSVTVECLTCHERIRAHAGPEPGRAACTFCGAMVDVLDQKTIAGRQPQEVASQCRDQIGEYAAGAPVATLPLRPGGVFDKLGEIRREVAPPPPRWTFFSGVFTFPWRRDVVVRWALMTVGFTALIVVSLVIKGLFSGLSGMAGGVAMAFFLMPIIWISVMTFSYAAACGLCVLEGTTAGLDRIEAWPDPLWKEWMSQMIYLGWIGAIPFAVGYGISQLAALAGARADLVFPEVLFVLYPVALMSALEANSVWVPLTLPILESLVRAWWCWLLFFLLTRLVAAGLTMIFVYSVISGNISLLLVLGPLLAAATLIYFRLLGRLGWRITANERSGAGSRASRNAQ